MINSNLLKLISIWNHHDKKCVVLNITSFGTGKYNSLMKTIEIFNFLPLMDNSVPTGLSFLLPITSEIISNHQINHIIKHYQIFSFFFYFILLQEYVVSVLYKTIWILKMFLINILRLADKKLILGFIGVLDMQINLIKILLVVY